MGIHQTRVRKLAFGLHRQICLTTSMTANPPQAPLFGFHWNEHGPDVLLNRGLVTIVAKDYAGTSKVVGTGFVVSSNDATAICITAAHVFDGIRQLQIPPARHSTALAEFLPPKKAVSLDFNSLQVVSSVGGQMAISIVEGLVFDENSDFALIAVATPFFGGDLLFQHEFLADDRIPEIGGLVIVLSFRYWESDQSDDSETNQSGVRFERRVVARIGRVLAYHPDGNRLCRGPCIETSIPVYSGMSGGPVLHYSQEGPLKVFGLVCSDPDLDGEDKENRAIEGRSTIALLPCRVTVEKDGKNLVSFAINTADVAGHFQSYAG